MASAAAMMIGGALVNALAYTGNNFLFSKLGKNQEAGASGRKKSNKIKLTYVHACILVLMDQHCQKPNQMSDIYFLGCFCMVLIQVIRNKMVGFICFHSQ